MTAVRLGAAAPSGPEQNLLRAALTADADDAARAWQAWRATTSVEDSPPRVHGLLPLVAARVPAADLGSDAATLGGLRRRAWAVRQRLATRLDTILPALAAAGVAAAPVRGTCFLAEPGDEQRPLTRLDLVVDPRHWTLAAGVVAGLGWRQAGWRSRSSTDLAWQDDEGLRLVLTWAPAFPDLLARPLSPTPTDRPGRLLVAVLEGLRPPGFEPLLWPVDGHLLAARMTASDWGVLRERADRCGVGPILSAGLAWLAHCADTPVPPEVVEGLARGRLDPDAGRRFTGYALGSADPDPVRRRVAIVREARRCSLDLSLGAPPEGFVTRVARLPRRLAARRAPAGRVRP